MVVLSKQLLALQIAAIGAGMIDGVSSLPVNNDAASARQDHLEARYTKARVGVALKDAAFPVKRDGIMSMPLTRMELPEGTDPLLAFQHHVNRANVKLSKMKGQAKPTSVSAAEGAKLRRRGLEQNSRTRRDYNPESARLLSMREDATPEDVAEGLVRLSRRSETDAEPEEKPLLRLSRRDRFFEHGRVGVVLKGKDASEAFTTSSTTPSKRNTLRKRLFGPLLDSLVSGTTAKAGTASSAPATSTAPMAGSSASVASAGAAVGKVAATVSKGYSQLDLAAAISGGLTPANKPTAEGSLGLDIEANDVGYVATIQVGSAQTPFRMLIDSGSADTWVPSTACTGCGNTHQQLGKKTSSTFKPLTGSTFSITYGTGAVRGSLGNDDVTIAGMTIKNHTLGLATQETVDFSDPTVPFDGLMGLAKMELSNSQTPTPIDALYSQGLVPAPVMGYHLGRVADGSNDGEVTFGGVDAQKYQGALVEIPNVSTQGFWEAAVDGVSFAGKDLAMSGRTAILDTGTSLIVAPQSDADAVHAAIPGSRADGQGGYTIPCTTNGSFAFTFGGQTFDVDPRDMTFLPVNQNDLEGDCVSSISAGSVGGPNEWLVGAAFLKNVYFATNAEVNVIGLAQLASSKSSSGTTSSKTPASDSASSSVPTAGSVIAGDAATPPLLGSPNAASSSAVPTANASSVAASSTMPASSASATATASASSVAASSSAGSVAQDSSDPTTGTATSDDVPPLLTGYSGDQSRQLYRQRSVMPSDSVAPSAGAESGCATGRDAARALDWM